MAKHELDLLWVTNPTNKYHEVKWGGQPYGLKPGEKRIFQRFLAEHFAKHLTNSILLGMEQEHHDKAIAGGTSESDYRPKSYMNSRSLRPKTIESILIGVYQYHTPQNTDPNAQIQAEIDRVNTPAMPEQKPIDLGEAPDPLYGTLKGDNDEVETTTPPEVQTPLAGAPLPQAAPTAPMIPTAMQPPQQPPTTTDKPERSMNDLRTEADKLGITVPFGTSKEKLKEMITQQYA